MHFVVASAVKEFINKKGMMASGDLIEGLNKLLTDMLEKSVERANENGRKTVRPCDL